MELILGEGGKPMRRVLDGEKVGRRREPEVLLGRGCDFK